MAASTANLVVPSPANNARRVTGRAPLVIAPADRLLALGLALQHRVLADQSSLGSFLDLE